jgi:hypothetical protein
VFQKQTAGGAILLVVLGTFDPSQDADSFARELGSPCIRAVPYLICASDQERARNLGSTENRSYRMNDVLKGRTGKPYACTGLSHARLARNKFETL